MKSFNIDIEAVEQVAYTAGMASIRAKVTVSEDQSPASSSSELHMSEPTLRRLHEGLGKVLANMEKHGSDITTTTVFPSKAR